MSVRDGIRPGRCHVRSVWAIFYMKEQYVRYCSELHCFSEVGDKNHRTANMVMPIQFYVRDLSSKKEFKLKK